MGRKSGAEEGFVGRNVIPTGYKETAVVNDNLRQLSG